MLSSYNPVYDSKEAVLQIRGNGDNEGILFSIFLNRNIGCDLHLEPSHQDSSTEGSQHLFLMRKEKNYQVLWL